jgi:rRNA-processing protein FCF1
MIVLVESNFVIEFAQRQAEIADAERIVTLAENREIELAIPACALFEPYETLVRRRKQRTGTVEQLGCKLFASFSNTRKYIENVAQRTHPLDS